MQSSGSMNKEISVGDKNRAIDELDNSGNGLEHPVGHLLHKICTVVWQQKATACKL